jgi:hypothetical protein
MVSPRYKKISGGAKNMKRVVLLALLALALPAAASTIDYEGLTTTETAVLSGTVGSGGTFTLTFSELAINGGGVTDGNVIFTITESTTSCGTGCFNIASGSVLVTDASNTTLFSSTLMAAGNVTEIGGTINISAFFAGGSGVANVTGLTTTVCVPSAGGVQCGTGSADVVAPVPEPGTLGMLGTGLIGLAGLVRRKLIG